MQLWTGRFSKALDKRTNDFNSSISFDSRMFCEDIDGSVAHAKMLMKQGIISLKDGNKIVSELLKIKEEIKEGELFIDETAEDIHTFIEGELTKRIGDAGKRLHTARSRNDQVATDVRLYLRNEVEEVLTLLREFISVLTKKAEKTADFVMSGYTHLQRAQPITFGHIICAYAEMFLRDKSRLKDALKRLNQSPLGACALAGTTYNTDRFFEAKELDFENVMRNSIDAVSDRDFCMELVGALSIISIHLSRFCEEIILWCSKEFSYITLDDSFSTGSSIMPQKKNPDIAELIRGKCGRVLGDEISLKTMLKGLPLAYNKDMQEDKEALFDAFDTVKICIEIFIPMFETMSVNKERLREAASEGFINATDCADYLVKKGMPFRDAYKLTGELVKYCEENKKTLEELSVSEYKSKSEIFGDDIYAAVDLDECVKRRSSYGGPSPQNVLNEISEIKKENEML
ncbi:MAG: argininosuccinate lyase [Candidatus Fimenecus sp.]